RFPQQEAVLFFERRHQAVGVHGEIGGLLVLAEGAADVDALVRQLELADRPHHLLHVDRGVSPPDLDHGSAFRSLVIATLSSRPFIASSRQKTSRAWRRKAGIERPTRSSCKTRCKEQPQSKGSCARALLPHAKVELGPACGGARGAQQKSPERRIARARWRSFGEYA